MEIAISTWETLGRELKRLAHKFDVELKVTETTETTEKEMILHFSLLNKVTVSFAGVIGGATIFKVKHSIDGSEHFAGSASDIFAVCYFSYRRILFGL